MLKIELKFDYYSKVAYIPDGYIRNVAFFEGQEDTAQAQSSYDVFKFINENERRITRSLR